MLQTQLKHLTTEEEARGLIEASPYVVICCGRMGPMCFPVYAILHQLESQYPHVTFRDMDFDTREASFIKVLPECRSFMSLPFTLYYKDRKLVRATSSIQTKDHIMRILDEEFGKAEEG